MPDEIRVEPRADSVAPRNGFMLVELLVVLAILARLPAPPPPADWKKKLKPRPGEPDLI
jgi:prepilin-type N-terminal cleavage/methylation domain-containing protein